LEKYSAILFDAINLQALALDDHRKKGFSLNAKSLCRLIRSLCTIKCLLDNEQVYLYIFLILFNYYEYYGVKGTRYFLWIFLKKEGNMYLSALYIFKI
jgi:hypothetical protein